MNMESVYLMVLIACWFELSVCVALLVVIATIVRNCYDSLNHCWKVRQK